MEGILDLFGIVSHSLRQTEYLEEYLESCTEHQAFTGKFGASSHVQTFIAYANTKLNTPADRLEGLLLLKTFLPQCTDEQFTQYAISWMLQCVKGIEMKTCVTTNSTAFHVLRILLQMAGKFPEMTKNVNNAVIAKFMEQLSRTDAKLQATSSMALQCVAVLIRYYGAPCTSHRGTLERYILQFADSKDAALVSHAARCFSLLPLAGGGGTAAANHKARWAEQQTRACATLQALRATLYENVFDVEGGERDSEAERLALAELSNMNPVVRVYQTANRFVNVCQFLEAMLTQELPVAKSVTPRLVMDLVRRGLSVNCATLGSGASSDILALSCVIPKIHVALLSLLTALVTCVRVNLYPHARDICKLLLDSLSWTCEASLRTYGAHAQATERPFSAVRVATYRTLATWLRVARAGSCVERVAEELFAVMAHDVYTERTTVKLNIQPGRKSKKLRKKLAAEAALSTTVAPGGSEAARSKLCNISANQAVCRAALDALYWLIHAAGVLLKPTLHKTMQETVLTVALELRRSPRDDMPIPYAGAKCRLALYRALLALTLEPHPSWPPPTQYALEVLARGQTDTSVEVSGYCMVALSSVEKLIHPPTQTLSFPVSLEEMLESVKRDESRSTTETVRVEDRGRFSPMSSIKHVTPAESAKPPTIADIGSADEGNLSDGRASIISTNSSFCDLDVARRDAIFSAARGQLSPNGSHPRAPPPTPSTPASKAGAKRKATEEGDVETKSPSKRNVVNVGLIGGSEVTKKLRLGTKRNEANVTAGNDDPMNVVDLSLSDDDEISFALSESNVSVASSNSNYQDLVLNKSLESVVSARDGVDKAANATSEVVGSEAADEVDSTCSTPTKDVRAVGSPEKSGTVTRSPAKKLSDKEIQEVLLEEEDNDCEIVVAESAAKDVPAAAAAKENGVARGDVNGGTATPKKIAEKDGKVSTVEECSSFQGLSDDQVVNLVVSDFMEVFLEK